MRTVGGRSNCGEGLGFGGSLSWADDRYSVHGELLARTSLEDFGDSRSFCGSVGFSAKW